MDPSSSHTWEDSSSAFLFPSAVTEILWCGASSLDAPSLKHQYCRNDPSMPTTTTASASSSSSSTAPRSGNSATTGSGNGGKALAAGMAAAANKWALSAGQTVQQWTVRRYALPDKHVASQVLMYRQLLHTKCRPGLVLSRPYQGTTAQTAVLDMPWWSTAGIVVPSSPTTETADAGGGDATTSTRTVSTSTDDFLAAAETTAGAQAILATGKMVISYDNLLARLWTAGACRPWGEEHEDLLSAAGSFANSETSPAASAQSSSSSSQQDAAAAAAPVPHTYWVDRLGFQQADPVTDFRSGGILSLAMMVHLVEACPQTHARFVRPHGDASVLPFGLTCINLTDMMARFLMLSKSVDRMDALLSQKPFWRMFADPHAVLVCHELAMEVTADVVCEFRYERRQQEQEQATAASLGDNVDGPAATAATIVSTEFDPNEKDVVSVFDFAEILSVVEQRMEHELLGVGPKSVPELRAIFEKQRQRRRQQQAQAQQAALREATTSGTNDAAQEDQQQQQQQQQPTGGEGTDSAPAGGRRFMQKAKFLRVSASAMAGNVFQKMKDSSPAKAAGDAARNATSGSLFGRSAVPTTAPPDLLGGDGDQDAVPPTPTVVALPPEPVMSSNTGATAAAAASTTEEEDDWNKDIAAATEGVTKFSIGTNEDDEDCDL